VVAVAGPGFLEFERASTEALIAQAGGYGRGLRFFLTSVPLVLAMWGASAALAFGGLFIDRSERWSAHMVAGYVAVGIATVVAAYGLVFTSRHERFGLGVPWFKKPRGVAAGSAGRDQPHAGKRGHDAELLSPVDALAQDDPRQRHGDERVERRQH
jgi:hypothetical protein